MKFAVTQFFLILYCGANSQILSIEDFEKSLNQRKEVFLKILESKEFKPETKPEATSFSPWSHSKKRHLKQNFTHSGNYTATIIYDRKSKVSNSIEIEMLKSRYDEFKVLLADLEKMGYTKKERGESQLNHKYYYKGNNVFILSIYYHGGYRLWGYSKNVLEPDLN